MVMVVTVSTDVMDAMAIRSMVIVAVMAHTAAMDSMATTLTLLMETRTIRQ